MTSQIYYHMFLQNTYHCFLCSFILYVRIYLRVIFIRGQSWRRDTKRDWLWVRSPFEEIKYLFKFPQYSAESSKRRILTLGSLYLSWCVRDTPWTWFLLIFWNTIYNVRTQCHKWMLCGMECSNTRHHLSTPLSGKKREAAYEYFL